MFNGGFRASIARKTEQIRQFGPWQTISNSKRKTELKLIRSAGIASIQLCDVRQKENNPVIMSSNMEVDAANQTGSIIKNSINQHFSCVKVSE